MLNRISKIALVLGLLLSATGLILNQKEATIYLVESGGTSWQFGRLLVFLLPGFISIPAILLALNFRGKKGFLGLIVSILFLFALDLLNYTQVDDNELKFKHPLINAFDSSDMWLGSHAYLLILMIICAGIQLGIRNDQKKVPIFVYFLFLPLFAISMADFPLYDTDFGTQQQAVPEKATHDRFNNIFLEELPQEYAVFVFSTGCGTCEQTATLLAATVHGHETIPVYMIFNASQNNVDEFIELTGADLKYQNLEHIQDFYDLTLGRVPKGYLVRNGKIIDLREGFFINYQFLDQLIK